MDARTRADHGVAAHGSQIALPGAGPGQIKDLPGARAPHELGERPLHGPRIRSLPAHTHRLLEEGLIKHKIRPFHV